MPAENGVVRILAPGEVDGCVTSRKVACGVHKIVLTQDSEVKLPIAERITARRRQDGRHWEEGFWQNDLELVTLFKIRKRP